MDVSIIIVSYNVKDFLKNCLESVIKFTKNINYEIIVVDNASTDDSLEMLKQVQHDTDNLKFIDAKENGGFAKGNNLGIKQAKGKYILLLNPDTLLVENSIERMFLWMEAHKDVAVASCQLVDSEQKILPTGGYFPTLQRIFYWAFFLDDIFKNIKSYHPHPSSFWSPVPRHPGTSEASDEQARGFAARIYSGKKILSGSALQNDNSIYSQEFFPDWITGAFFMVRKDATNKDQILDENFFMYGEELEWCMRFKESGYKVGYTPITKIIHLERKSSDSLPRNAILGEFKGLKYIYAKHFPGWQQIVLGSLLDLAAFARIVFWLVRLKPKMSKIYLEALFI